MTMMGVTAVSGFGILLAAVAATTILRKRSASLRHLVWTVALGLLVAVPAFHAADLRVEVPVPAEWLPTPSVAAWDAQAGTASREAASTASSPDMVGDRGAHGSAVGAPSGAGRSTSPPGSYPGEIDATEAATASAPRTRVSGGRASGGSAFGGRAAGTDGGTGAASGSGAGVAAGFGAGLNGDLATGNRSAPGGDGSEVSAARDVAATSDRGFGLSDVLLLVWALGAMVLVAGTLFSHLAARRLVTTDVERASPRASRRFAQLCVKLGVQRPARLVVNPQIRVPATWGFRRATVVLPPEYESWPAETLERVLLHELAHVQRGDCLAAVLGECARALHWPNPLAWLALSRQRAESEHACDDLVLRAGEAPSEYAHDLLRFVRAFSTSTPIPEASLAMARPSGLGRRVRAVLDPAQSRGAPHRSVTIALGAIAILSSFGATAVVPVARAQEEPPRAEQVTAPSPDPVDEPSTPPVAAPLAAPGAAAVFEPGPEPADWPLPVPGGPSVDDEPRAATPPTAGRAWLGPNILPGVFPFVALPPVDQSQELCVFREEGSRSTSINSERDRMTIRWETDGCSVEIEVIGDVEFSADDRAIARMARGARFDLEERIGRTGRRVRLDGTSSGIERRYWVDRDETEWNAEADTWLATMLPELFRHTTLNAEERVQRFLAEGGSDRVFGEVEQMHSDHVISTYLELLMREAELSDQEYTRIIDYAGQLDSDHTSGELLLAVVETAGLRPSFERPMLRAAEGLESDHQKTRVLTTLLEADLGPSQLDAVVESAATIESDHSLAEVLSTVAATGRLSDVGRVSFFGALRTIESDHNQARVLEAFLDSGRLSEDEVSRVLEMTTGIESDHQRAMILQRVASDFSLSGDQVTAYLGSAASLESDHQIATTAEMIIDRADFTREHLALVLTMADRIDSDHQRGAVLERVILRQDLSTVELEEVLMVAEGIDSDHQLGSTLSLILEDETLTADGVAAVLASTRSLRSSRERVSILVKLAGIYDVRGDALAIYEELAEDLDRRERSRVMEALRG